MKFLDGVVAKLLGILDSSLSRFSKNTADTLLYVDVNSSDVPVPLQKLVAGLRQLQPEDVELYLHQNPLETCYVAATSDTYRLFSKSKAALSSTLASAGREVGYATRIPALERKISTVIAALPVAFGKRILDKVQDGGELPGIVQVNITGSKSGTPVELKLTHSKSSKVSKELDKKVSEALTGYFTSSEFAAELAAATSVTVSDTIKLGKATKPTAPKAEKVVATKLKSATPAKKLPQLRELSGRFSSLATLLAYINSDLAEQIAINMGDGDRKDILNYRTGRFAESAEVLKITQGRTGMLTAFYTYMKYPYQTFEPGFKQGLPRSRNPRLLISKSIHQLAASKVANRMRAVLV